MSSLILPGVFNHTRGGTPSSRVFGIPCAVPFQQPGTVIAQNSDGSTIRRAPWSTNFYHLTYPISQIRRDGPNKCGALQGFFCHIRRPMPWEVSRLPEGSAGLVGPGAREDPLLPRRGFAVCGLAWAVHGTPPLCLVN